MFRLPGGCSSPLVEHGVGFRKLVNLLSWFLRTRFENRFDTKRRWLFSLRRAFALDIYVGVDAFAAISDTTVF